MQLVARRKIVQHADPEARLFARQHTSAYVSIRQNTSAYVQHADPEARLFVFFVSAKSSVKKNIKKMNKKVRKKNGKK